MKYNDKESKPSNNNLEGDVLQGVYGNYRITNEDQIEVQRYRLSVLFCAIAFCIGLGHWILLGPNWAGVWLFLMAVGLGFALKWIHIYVRPLHQALKILWGIGCVGLTIIVFNFGVENIFSIIASKPIWTFAIGPLFAALTGLGFKEFFCFRRPEAVGLTLLIPIAMLGHLSGLVNGGLVMILLCISALLLLILSLRKFGMDAAADVGDKSVFEYLDNQQMAQIL